MDCCGHGHALTYRPLIWRTALTSVSAMLAGDVMGAVLRLRPEARRTPEPTDLTAGVNGVVPEPVHNIAREFGGTVVVGPGEVCMAVATVCHNGVKIHDAVKITSDNTLRGLGGDLHFHRVVRAFADERATLKIGASRRDAVIDGRMNGNRLGHGVIPRFCS